MPALLSALVFFIFAGMVSNPAPAPPGEEFIPGHGAGGRIDCIPDDASSGPVAIRNIPKPNPTNVPFVDTGSPFVSCQGSYEEGTTKSCDINPWRPGETVPDIADYTTVVGNVIISKIWPDNDTTRLAKQILPDPPSDGSPDPYVDLRDNIYRATCNDWCYFTPPRREIALPYGGTFFCEFIFFYKGQNISGKTGDRKFIETGPRAGYPDDTNCQPDKNYEDCPLFDILIRKDAPVPDYAGGAAPGSKMQPLKCSLVDQTPTPTTTSYKDNSKQSALASAWVETARAQTQGSFIDLPTGPNGEKQRWIFDSSINELASKINGPDERKPVLGEDETVMFQGVEYLPFTNLLASITPENLLHLITPSELDRADNASQPLNETINLLQFNISPDIRPAGKTLQLGTFFVATARGWWELFPKESKPAIYLYPEKPIALNVKLGTKGKLTISNPPYDPEQGWNVIAYPDGTLTLLDNPDNPDTPDIPSYPYLYYEAILDRVHIKPTGFLVAGQELQKYFETTLPQLGLNQRETADFIAYWMTRLNVYQPYYFIHYLSEDQIEQLEPLQISLISPISPILPRTSNLEPRTSIRIRPYFKPLSTQEADQLQLTPQQLPIPQKRQGFTLVEWGGILVKD